MHSAARARPSRLSRALRRAADALYPPVCLHCRADLADPGLLCPACWAATPFLASPVCDRCGAPVTDDVPDAGDAPVCDHCLGVPFAFSRARAAVLYEGVARAMVLKLKHADRSDLAGPGAAWMARIGAPLLAEADALVPIPLHPLRFLSRRGNQSAELARRLAPRCGVPTAPELLLRRRRTPSQGGLAADEIGRAHV